MHSLDETDELKGSVLYLAGIIGTLLFVDSAVEMV